jgi:hypothetical protein
MSSSSCLCSCNSCLVDDNVLGDFIVGMALLNVFGDTFVVMALLEGSLAIWQ